MLNIWRSALFFFAAIVADAGGAEIEVWLSRTSPTPIAGLEFPDKPLPVKTESSDEGVKTYVIVRGSFKTEQSHMVWEDEVVEPNAKGDFQIKVPIGKDDIIVHLVAVDAYGAAQSEEIIIAGIGASRLSEVAEKDAAGSSRKLFLTPNLGLSFISFEESGVPDFTEVAFTGKATATYALSSEWDLGMTSFLTLFPVSRSQDVTARFLGVNLRAGYALPWLKSPWKLGVSAGGYYTTMFVSPAAFGFKNMAGPQVFPTVQYTLSGGQSVQGYFKFSPVTTGSSPFAFKNREIALGGAYSRLLKTGNPVSATLDVAFLDAEFPRQAMSSTVISIGAGYGL